MNVHWVCHVDLVLHESGALPVGRYLSPHRTSPLSEDLVASHRLSESSLVLQVGTYPRTGVLLENCRNNVGPLQGTSSIRHAWTESEGGVVLRGHPKNNSSQKQITGVPRSQENTPP